MTVHDDPLRLELQSAMFDIADSAYRNRQHSSGDTLPQRHLARPSDTEGSEADAFVSLVGALDLAQLSELRHQLAVAFLHEVDRGLAAGYLRAMNEEMK